MREHWRKLTVYADALLRTTSTVYTLYLELLVPYTDPYGRRRGRYSASSAYVSIRQHTSAYAYLIQTRTDDEGDVIVLRQHTSAFVSIRQHTHTLYRPVQTTKGTL